MASDTTHRTTHDSWQKPTLYAALVLILAAALIGIVFLLSVPGKFSFSTKSAVARETPEPEITLQPYAVATPPAAPTGPATSPARRHYVQSRPGNGSSPGLGGAGDEASSAPLPSGEFLAAVASGRKILLPHREGKCIVVGSVGTTMTQALDDCFAGQSASR